MGNERRSPLLSPDSLAYPLTGQGLDDLAMLRELPCEGSSVRQFEFCKVKAGRYRTAYQCIFAVFGGYGGEPAACFYYELKMFSFFDVGSQPVDGEDA